MRTEPILLCTGINVYADKAIKKLSYCAWDCLRIQRSFKAFNICTSSILLINENATLKHIISTVSNLRNQSNKLIFYYSGHGAFLNGKSYIYTYDTEIENLADTALSIQKFVDLLKKLNFKNAKLVIDACNTFSPSQLPEEINLTVPNKKITYEDTAENGSPFTNEFLKKTAETHQFIYHKNNSTRRYQKLRQSVEKRLLIKNMVLLLGESGIGKSHFLRELQTRENNVFYISIPKSSKLSFEIVLTLISENMASPKMKLRIKRLDTEPERYIRFLAYAEPYNLLLIDHIERLSPLVTFKLINFLSELPIQKILSSKKLSKNIPHGIVYNFPPMDNLEIHETLNLMGIKNNSLRQCCTKHSNGNYLKLLNTIVENSIENPIHHTSKDMEKYLKKSMLSIAATGGFIHQELFEKTFNISKTALEKLKQLGMIILHNGFFYPHDSIYDEIKQYSLHDFQDDACNYWKGEINTDTSNMKAIQNYVLVISTFSPTFNNNEISFYKNIIGRLNGRKNTYFLLLLVDYIKKEGIPTELRFFLAEILVDIGKVENALDLIKNKNGHLIHSIFSTLLSEIHWWKGNFSACIGQATVSLEKETNANNRLNLLASRGIGYFFMGQWEKASTDFSNVIEAKTVNSAIKSVFFSYCILATMQGLRGINFKESVANFKCAARLAQNAGKLSWLAITYGNIGEILWKIGYLQDSLKILEMGKHFAYITGTDQVELEINRNLLHVYYKSNNKKTSTQLAELEKMLPTQTDSYVKMQIINTLVTHYIFEGNQIYENYLLQAEKLTAGNAEYQIYTKSNIAIANLYKEKVEAAKKVMQEALNLCSAGENWLAIKQIFDDWNKIIVLHHLDSSLSTKQVFPKWHQILEKKLVPNLSHFSCLCEYLL